MTHADARTQIAPCWIVWNFAPDTGHTCPHFLERCDRAACSKHAAKIDSNTSWPAQALHIPPTGIEGPGHQAAVVVVLVHPVAVCLQSLTYIYRDVSEARHSYEFPPCTVTPPASHASPRPLAPLLPTIHIVTYCIYVCCLCHPYVRPANDDSSCVKPKTPTHADR